MAYNLKVSYANIDELETHDKALNVLYGRKTSGELVPISIDDDGHIVIGTGIVLAPSDIRLGAVEIQDNDSGTRTDVIQIGDLISLPPFSSTSDNYRGFLLLGRDVTGAAQPFNFDGFGNLKIIGSVSVVNLPSPGSVNKFGTQSIASGIFTTIVSQSVPLGMTFNISGFKAWGDIDSEWILISGASNLGGIRTSPSKLSEGVLYSEPITVVGPATVELKTKHYDAVHTIDFYANLEGRLV